MNMTVTYRFKDLQELAAFYESRAREERASINGATHRHANIERRARAFVYETIADQLRRTTLEEQPK